MRRKVYIYHLLYFFIFRESFAYSEDDIRPQLYVLLKAFEAEGPFTGLGFFVVGRPGVLAIFSTVLTYFIILFQFKLSKF